MKTFVLFFIFTVVTVTNVHCQRLSKEDILNIPHIDNLSPVAAHHKQDLHINISLYINDMKLEEVDGEFRLYAAFIWLAAWVDGRLDGIKEEVIYFNKSQIWTPDIHSYNNEIAEEKISNHYANTISVRKKGEVEYTVFETFESTCRLTDVSKVSCFIGLEGFFGFAFNYNQLFDCNKQDCFKFTNSFLKIGNESRRWTLGNKSFHSHMMAGTYSSLVFSLYFNRGVDIAYYCVKYSSIIITILLLSQFLLPIHSKVRFVINGFSYILVLMMILNQQYEFFNLDIKNSRLVGVFYTMALFFVTLCWAWNVISGNIWISCSHEYKPSTDTMIYRILTHKYLSWFTPKEVVDADSFLMKVIFVLDKCVFLVVVLCLISVLV